MKNKKRLFFICVFVALVIILALYFLFFHSALLYSHAKDCLNSGKYPKAISVFSSLEDYKDSSELLKESKYLYAQELIQSDKESDQTKGAYLFADIYEYKGARVFFEQFKWVVSEAITKSGDEISETTVYTYDQNGNETCETTKNSDGEVIYKITTTYNEQNLPVQKNTLHTDLSGTDGFMSYTIDDSYAYNADGQITREKSFSVFGDEPPIYSDVEYIYDTDGRLIQVIRDGSVENYTYDNEGRLSTEKAADNSWSTEYIYNPHNDTYETVTMDDINGRTVSRYDEKDRLLMRTTYDSPDDLFGEAESFTYDGEYLLQKTRIQEHMTDIVLYTYTNGLCTEERTYLDGELDRSETFFYNNARQCIRNIHSTSYSEYTIEYTYKPIKIKK